MSEEFETQQGQTSQQIDSYADTNAAADKGKGKKDKKKMSGSTMAATVVSFAVVYLFGLLGGLICYGCYWIVRAIIKSKMAVALKVILSVVVILVFMVLFIVFIIAAAYLKESL